VGNRSEFAAAYGLKLLPAKTRFTLAMNLIERGKSYSRNFPQFLGLTARDDLDHTVRDAYLASLRRERVTANKGCWGNTGFATAVSVALGVREDENPLRKWLDEAYDNFVNERFRNLKLQAALGDNSNGLVTERVREGTPQTAENPMGALEYLACLALSWLRFREIGEEPAAHGLVATPADVSVWPSPTIPSAVLAAGLVPALWGYGKGTTGEGESPPPISIFPAEVKGEGSPEASKPSVPPPTIPAPIKTDEYSINVNESDAEIDTHIPILTYDRVTIKATGTIWAGVVFAGRNGPGGWNGIDNSHKFPLPGSHPFCLLYKLVPQGQDSNSVEWNELGPHAGSPPESVLQFMWPLSATTLFFRINDDRPGNGNGFFTCSISVERPPH
jgi:hypothetical protein